MRDNEKPERQLRRIARRQARRHINKPPIIILSAEDSLAVMAAILHPESPSPRLRQAAERYKRIMGDQ